MNKQHIARPSQDIRGMAADSIVYTVAKALADCIAEKDITEAELGKKAKVSPRTVANFLRPEKRAVSASGKAPSGKLTELEMIARALDVQVADLFAAAPRSPPAMRLAELFDERVPGPLRQSTYAAILNQIEWAVTAARAAKEQPAPTPKPELEQGH